MGAASSPDVVVHRDAELLAQAVAARFLTRLVDLQSGGRIASVVLTGGSIAISIYAAVAASPTRDAVDWGRIELWWGDERFLVDGDPNRNATQAGAALLDVVPLNLDLLHPMPAAPRVGVGDPEAAAEAYARELASASRPGDHARVPAFDLLLLGVGPDGHVASLFPGHPALHDERAVAAVRAAPKPPPIRLTLTFPTLARACEAWFVVSGADKAPVVRSALSGAGRLQVPAAGVTGQRRTRWLLDKAAAAQLPSDLARTVSP
ncbi:MAG TPA: 6-phosphogluconolactonase [Nocardioidaceae bacterium]|nr:6-phosphogluconolactonase [Nocardioidaceae bacterium]